ncbi:MAG: efflux RND transporter periplasmic adaptor subunit [Chitinophagales bacterium]
MQRIFQLSIVLFVILTITSCSYKEEPKKATTTPVAANFKTMVLLPRQISGNVQLPGVMQPFQFVQLFPRISGFVKSVYVDRGSVVKQGQTLIVLEAPEIEQQVAAAKLRYTQAEATYITSKDRYRRLLETSHTPGTVSPYDLEAAASKMQGDSATSQGEYANYRAQETMKTYLTINAPFDGVITERNVHPGALAGPSAQNAKPMLVLQQLSRLRLVVDIPEQFATQIKNGDEVHYKINAIPGEDFKGTVSRSSQSLGNTYRSETIEIDAENTGNKFKPGMYAEVVLPTSGSANAYVVPKSAVVTTTERKYVITVDDNSHAKWVDISEGNQSSDSTEIFGNLHNGTVVITNASYQVKDGGAVK